MSPDPSGSPEPCAPGLAEILGVVRARSGIDFGGYRSPTLERRVQNRMLAVFAASYAEYLQRLRENPAEIDLLVDRLTIKVSRFFRNAGSYRRLGDIALDWRRSAPAGERFRVWSAGCGNGEEPYSLAMLLSGLPGPPPAGSICATDIDETALAVARTGCYPQESLEEMPADARGRWLVPSGDRARPHRVVDGVASMVRFLRHDLTAAAPPPWDGRFHLVSCRNALIYFRQAVQQRVQELLLASLAPGGYLFLGEAELPCPSLLPRLDVVDRAARLYRLASKKAP